MKDLWAEYKKEREGVMTLRHLDLGFAAYSIDGEECYLQEVYVVPEARQEGIGAELTDVVEGIAKEHGCKVLTTTVYKAANGVTVSTLAILKVGFEIHSWTDEKIIFMRRIK
jgi:GNAT superfamily N-acetyltransferase